jgi:class 3 adenylate cyclase/tetratricopeptide (TPR) repeat protein
VSDAARTLGAYIPQDRRRALAGGAAVPERQRGAALFADLSGFTALTERLANRLGPLRGAEELGAWLRRIYDPLVACIEDEDGTVLGFSGDAMTCFLDGDDGARAVRAAERMQREVARLHDARAADGGRIGVRIKVAVAVGEVRRFTAGDPGRRLWDVMAGSTLMRLAAMEQNAEPGEVLADAAAARASGREVIALRDDGHVLRPAEGVDQALLVGGEDDAGGDAVDGAVAPAGAEAYRWEGASRRGDGGPWPDPATSAPWAPEVARERVAHGEEPLGDFRPAGAVFLSFGGIDWDADPDAGTRLDRFLRHVQREVAEDGGTLVQVTVGDKGSYLYAAFGAPRAHGDDARRAVACALRLVKASGPEVGGVDGLRAGVAYGAMYTGSYGGATRLSYGVLGPKTNLAARLMKRAGAGEVLCDPEAARRARRAIRFSALPAERFKGVAEPVPLHLAVRELRDDERDGGPMFGRDAERIDVGGLLVQLQHGDGGYLRYQGEAGTGKTRLLAWAAESAGQRGVRALTGRADEGGREAGYRLWRGPVRQLLDLPEGATPETVTLALDRVGADRGELRAAAPVLAELLAPGGAEAARDGAARREAIGHAVRALLGAALDGGPLVLLLDDVDRMDERSADLLGRLADLPRERALAMIAVHRPVGGEVAAALEAHLPGPARPLSGLEAEASRMLVARVLGAPAMAVPYAVATAIHERAAGVPVLVEEIVRDLLERDAIRVDTHWRGIGRDARGAAPRQREVRVGFDEAAIRDLKGGLDALLLARLDRLTSAERTAMKTAAVVGRTAEHQPLAHLLERDPVALESALASLEGPDMLQALPDAHRFQQTGMHEAAYENLLYEQRRALHRQMSAWYLQRLRAGEEVDAERMAFHFFHATEGEDDPDLVRPALASLEEVAERHLAAGAHDEALAALGRAERLVPAGADWDADRARVALRTAEVLERSGRHRDARDLFRTAADVAQRAGDAAREAEAEVGLASLALHRGDGDAARDAAARARELAAATGDDRIVGRAELAAARACEARGEAASAVAHARAALAAWGRIGADGDGTDGDGSDGGAAVGRDGELRGRIEAGRVLLAGGAADDAAALLTAALETAERAGRPYLEGLAGLHLADVMRRRGVASEAEERYQRALSIFGGLGATREATVATQRLGEVAIDDGRLVDADRRFAEALEAAVRLRAGPQVVAAAVGRARVAWLRGHQAWAVGILDAAREHPALAADTAEQVVAALDEAASRLGRRGLDEAREAGGRVRVEAAREAPTGIAARFGRGGRGRA